MHGTVNKYDSSVYLLCCGEACCSVYGFDDQLSIKSTGRKEGKFNLVCHAIAQISCSCDYIIVLAWAHTGCKQPSDYSWLLIIVPSQLHLHYVLLGQ